jgi:hypothetical protein
MTDAKTLRGALIAAALTLVALIAIPAISSADKGSRDDDDRTVGTITSFDAETNVLTITATNGDEVSARVVKRTEIECEDEDDDGDGSGHDGDGDGGSGPGKRGRGRDDDRCSTDALVEGAEVEKAELDLTGSGLVWDEVEVR